ncbi:MAG TPA: energy transducer TonB [Allosphingosinicella sp.]|nr:energy transducer TonB [Allosphingosinicella sp.]
MSALERTALERVRAATPALLIHAAVLYALLQTQLSLPSPLPDQLKLIDLSAEPPPPPVEELPPPPPPPAAGKTEEKMREAPRPEGAASPPNIVSKATEIVAPVPVVPPIVPPPVTAAPVAATGSDSSTGAAPVPGPGTGSGGIGNGTGSGGSGNGPGGGGGGGDGRGGDGAGGETPPRHIRGRIRDSDYPRPDAHGLVSVQFAVQPTGRATNCRTVRSSGDSELDQLTCRLIEQRFVYEPSRDRHGRPVISNLMYTHEWVSEYTFPERETRRRRGW